LVVVKVVLVEYFPQILLQLGLIPAGVIVVAFNVGARVVLLGSLATVAVFLLQVE
jgi:hypothetical protein